MTTESDLQAMLDLNPDDWQTRGVLADWLRDRDDPRADGYAALALLRRYPVLWQGAPGARRWGWLHSGTARMYRPNRWPHAVLPDDWYAILPRFPIGGRFSDVAEQWPTRQAAEDEVALAFPPLPADRRAELLGQGVPT